MSDSGKGRFTHHSILLLQSMFEVDAVKIVGASNDPESREVVVQTQWTLTTKHPCTIMLKSEVLTKHMSQSMLEASIADSKVRKQLEKAQENSHGVGCKVWSGPSLTTDSPLGLEPQLIGLLATSVASTSVATASNKKTQKAALSSSPTQGKKTDSSAAAAATDEKSEKVKDSSSASIKTGKGTADEEDALKITKIKATSSEGAKAKVISRTTAMVKPDGSEEEQDSDKEKEIDGVDDAAKGEAAEATTVTDEEQGRPTKKAKVDTKH